MTIHKKISIVILTALAIPVGNLQADIIFSHSGAVDPETEGWTQAGDGTNVTEGPVFDDLGSGLDAWFVSDSSTTLGSITHFLATPTGEDILAASTKGWSLSVNLRMVTGTIGSFDAMAAGYEDGTTRYLMTFDRESDGDPTVTLDGGSSFTLEGVGDGDYHLYELTYDTSDSTVDLFVDGVERISDFAGKSSTLTRVVWGANGSDATGRGHFNSLAFSVVPEPGSCAALPLMLMLATARRRRRSR